MQIDPRFGQDNNGSDDADDEAEWSAGLTYFFFTFNFFITPVLPDLCDSVSC